jgi:hypothetical protein
MKRKRESEEKAKGKRRRSSEGLYILKANKIFGL